jgi:hypothetical protein
MAPVYRKNGAMLHECCADAANGWSAALSGIGARHGDI